MSCGTDESLYIKTQLFLSNYAQLLDNKKLNEWTGLFDEDCKYVVTTKQEHNLKRQLHVINCSNKNMLRDRISGIEKAVFYREREQRRLVGSPNITVEKDEISGQAPFALYESYGGNSSKIIATGEYRVLIRVDSNRLVIAELICVVDSPIFPDSLIYPI